MKTETLQIKYDAEKLSTLRLYMNKAQDDVDGELEKCIGKAMRGMSRYRITDAHPFL